ncbi:unnamed protein product [Acanthosepion pharaonis]|uniref:Uncharacterized protein n=1 Tax=Acanthosepion pharaonis TaxID=158019 RepID=A0A812BKG2_ACAPH|nr:unnamed protein product [Sepia pharaonis]
MHSSTKCEQRQLMYPSYLATSCTDLPSTRIKDPDMSKNTQLTTSRRECHLGASVKDQQASPDVMYQEIGETSGGKRTALMYPDCHREVLSSHADSEHGWDKGNTAHREEMSDQYSSHYSLAHTPWTNQDTYFHFLFRNQLSLRHSFFLFFFFHF